ncbi:polysaccharide biosynthesis/export family protein [Sphingosinicella sp. CPCC 101087]|uniref:polysaccharide biosynthesis/export family protein n=1 Tax=Sphingosinicella sp. CPCC 101087 TaxID=2497754 RepID=UPI00101BC1DB|nr:polysaccharide biosynthesis/export family protein [Sphingosinicella sp. CPCC 101087]
MTRSLPFALSLVLTASLAACSQGPFPVSENPPAPASAHALGPGERLRVTVYGEPALTGEYVLSSGGELAFPLAGTIQAAGKSPDALATELAASLKNMGYLLDPNVAVEVLAYRPFYVLGEVNQPGEFPYQPGLTVLAAVARAEGFTYRARQSSVFIKRAGEPAEREVPLTSDLIVQPGDIVRIGERYF